MVRLLVLYGQPQDPSAFDKYYREIHIPLAKRMKGLKKWTVGKVTGTAGGEPSPYIDTSRILTWRAARHLTNCSLPRKGRRPSPMCQITRPVERPSFTQNESARSELVRSG